MIPVLFDASATVFSTNGIGRLLDAISCVVVEELNGEFELTMEYPADGIFADKIVHDSLIVCNASIDLARQAFRVYRITKPINGIFTVYAAHLSYDLNYIPVGAFTAIGFADTAAGLVRNSLEANPFTITTEDITNTTTEFILNTPKGCRACLGGSDESIAQSFSGSSGVEFKFDNYTVYADLHRGSDKGYELRYGKNITDIKQEENIEDTITGVLPIWSGDGVVYAGDIQYNSYYQNYPFHRTVVYDFFDSFESAPTAAQLNTAGYNYINGSGKGVPAVNITVSFVDLFGTSAYSEVQALETVCMGDIVTVYFAPLGISETAEVIETKWNVLTDRYNSITVGTKKSNLADTLVKTITEVTNMTDRLVSMNIRLDYAEGEAEFISARVAQNEDNISKLFISTDEISTTVSDNKTETDNSIATLSTQIQQVSDGITATITSEVSSALDGNEQIQLVKTNITADQNGITIGKSNSQIHGTFANNGLYFETQNDTTVAWVDGENQTMGANELQIGDATQANKRWRVFATSDGAHLRFTRHS